MTEYAKLVVAVDSTQAKQTIDVLIRLEDAGRKVDDTNKKMERSSRSLAGTLTRLAAPLAAFLSVRAVIRASDEYGQMASRIRNATESTEEYEMVQARLLETANGTYRALSEAQEVYLSTADTLRDLGYATSEVLDITDSFSYALVRDAARVDQATSAMDAYSKSLMKGKIDADAWATIMAATPSLVEGISEATGRATSEIRQLGASGKLSIEALNEGLRISREENKRFADAMETSVEDAVINLQNSFGVLIGKVNESTGASSGLVTSLESLAELLRDPDIVQGVADITSSLVTLTSWLIEATVATYNFFDELTDRLAGIRNLTEVERLEEEILSLQIELNNLTGDLASPDWLLSIRGLDRGELEAQAKSLKLMIDGLRGTLSSMKEEEGLARLSDALDGVLDKLGGFREFTKPVRTVSATLSDAEREAGRLEKAYESMVSGLERQIALFGDTTEAARVRYELESGSLQGIVGQQREYLIGLASELDMKRQIQEAERAGEQYRQTMGEIAMGTTGNPELDRLTEAYFRRKEIIDNALATEYLTQQQHDAAMVLLDQETAAARQRVLHEYQQAQEQATLQTMSSIVTITQSQIQQMQGLVEQGGAIGKAFFVMTQTLAAANAIVQGFQSAMAIRTAYAQLAAMTANPLTAAAGEAHATAAQAMGFATAGMIAAQTIQSFDGGGYTGNGPRSGGLDGKGGFMAMVHPRETIIDHTKQKGGGGAAPVINIRNEITIEAQPGASAEEAQRYGREFAGAADALIIARLERESRPGGLLWQMYGGGR